MPGFGYSENLVKLGDVIVSLVSRDAPTQVSSPPTISPTVELDELVFHAGWGNIGL